jgi:hypothetical protein
VNVLKEGGWNLGGEDLSFDKMAETASKPGNISDQKNTISGEILQKGKLLTITHYQQVAG